MDRPWIDLVSCSSLMSLPRWRHWWRSWFFRFLSRIERSSPQRLPVWMSPVQWTVRITVGCDHYLEFTMLVGMVEWEHAEIKIPRQQVSDKLNNRYCVIWTLRATPHFNRTCKSSTNNFLITCFEALCYKFGCLLHKICVIRAKIQRDPGGQDNLSS